MNEPYETLLGHYRDSYALWPFLDGDEPDWRALDTLDTLACASSGERVLVEVARAVHNGDRTARVADLRQRLDGPNRARVAAVLFHWLTQ